MAFELQITLSTFTSFSSSYIFTVIVPIVFVRFVCLTVLRYYLFWNYQIIKQNNSKKNGHPSQGDRQPKQTRPREPRNLFNKPNTPPASCRHYQYE
jgi:hypothetical protein